MADKNVGDAMILNPVPEQLHQRAFTAINQKIAFSEIEKLAGRMPVVIGCCRAAAEYR